MMLVVTLTQPGAERSVGLVLAGGRSRRMGRDKASLSVGDSTALQRVVLALRGAGLDVVVLARADQDLALDRGDGVEVWPDAPQWSDRGPLWAMGHAMGRLAQSSRYLDAFVTSCDAIALDSRDVETVLSQRRAHGDDAVVVVDAQGRAQPLLASYRVDAGARVTAALRDVGERRLSAVLDHIRWRALPADTLVQPLVAAPCNTPQQWRAACAAVCSEPEA